MKKRMLSAILAMSMVMGMGTVTAFAEETSKDPSGSALNVENNEFTKPNIDITVPTITANGAITLDPYNIANKGQIYSPEYQVINNSNVPVVFSIKEVTATGTAGENDALDIVAKKLTDGSKWATVSISITDGLGKTTTKVVPKNDTAVETEDIDIAATTYMAAYGGVATFNYTGSCADNVTKDGYKAWATTDKIAVNAKYSFAPIQCTPITVAKTLKASVSEIEVKVDDEEPTLPATIIADSKYEIPVVWELPTDVTFSSSTAGTFTYTAKIADTDLDSETAGTQSAAASGLYTIPEKITMPTITVKVVEAEQGS